MTRRDSRNPKGLQAEGIFRLSGRATQIDKLRTQLDQGKKVFFSEDMDVHSVATLFKQWLRELPEPLLTWRLYKDFIGATRIGLTLFSFSSLLFSFLLFSRSVINNNRKPKRKVGLSQVSPSSTSSRQSIRLPAHGQAFGVCFNLFFPLFFPFL